MRRTRKLTFLRTHLRFSSTPPECSTSSVPISKNPSIPRPLLRYLGLETLRTDKRFCSNWFFPYDFASAYPLLQHRRSRFTVERDDRAAGVYLVVCALRKGRLRNGELARKLEGITPKMLTQTLRVLDRDGLVRREIFPGIPPRVEYELTDLGQSLAGLLTQMLLTQIRSWAEQHAPDIKMPGRGRLPNMKAIWPPRWLPVLLATLPPRLGEVMRPPGWQAPEPRAGRASADHGAAAADFGFADLGVTRFQHFRLGKLRFSFAE
ncbi:helix-turn-helix transcriptional regulator [Mesorhizobium sp. M1338]